MEISEDGKMSLIVGQGTDDRYLGGRWKIFGCTGNLYLS